MEVERRAVKNTETGVPQHYRLFSLCDLRHHKISNMDRPYHMILQVNLHDLPVLFRVPVLIGKLDRVAFKIVFEGGLNSILLLVRLEHVLGLPAVGAVVE